MIEGNVTISIKDFDSLRHSEDMLKDLLRRLKQAQHVEWIEDEETFILEANTVAVEEILKDFNAEDEVDNEMIEKVIWK